MCEFVSQIHHISPKLFNIHLHFYVQVEEWRRRDWEKMAVVREALVGAGGATEKLNIEVSGEKVGDRVSELF